MPNASIALPDEFIEDTISQLDSAPERVRIEHSQEIPDDRRVARITDGQTGAMGVVDL
jgi:hypothetical protein